MDKLGYACSGIGDTFAYTPLRNYYSSEMEIRKVSLWGEALKEKVKQYDDHFKGWVPIVDELSKHSVQEVKDLFNLLHEKEQTRLDRETREEDERIRKEFKAENKPLTEEEKAIIKRHFKETKAK